MKARREPFCRVRYTVSCPRLAPGRQVKAVYLSDLHGKVPRGLAAAVAEEAPDLILLGGDLFEQYLPPGEKDDYHEILDTWLKGGQRRFIHALKRADAFFVGRRRRKASGPEENEPIYRFLAEIAPLAPTCFAPGNHERLVDGAARARLAGMGVRYLENAAVTPVPGVAVGGLAIRYDTGFLDAFAAREETRVLLCHCPDYYDRLPAGREMDLVLAGHAHGGQIRLFGHGVFAPGQGFFPKYDGGRFGNLIVGRGLANTTLLPRLFNPREMVVLTLCGEKHA